MKKIVKIIIKGSSGYCSFEEAYNDKIIITPEAIEYKYVPRIETELNPVRSWKYKTNSPIFKMKYERILESIEFLMTYDSEEAFVDSGVIEFNITYSDNTVFKRKYFSTSEQFKKIFKEIKDIVPECEYVPAVLLTEEDYNEE